MADDPDEPTTEQLRAIQSDRERRESDEARAATDDVEARTHERRAERAAYLRDKLAEQAESERD